MYSQSLFILAIVVARSSQIQLASCVGHLRRPEFTDIAVQCGTNSIGLAIEICPAIYTGYNESLLILNHLTDQACRGTLDETAVPPVVRYNFPLNMTHSCGSIFRTTSTAGTGIFSDFSNIQTVNISGIVRSFDPTTGTITYNAELKYYYSCAYPLEYLINNTQIDVSANSIALKDNNGSFISTLSMELFSDVNYTRPLIIPERGIELRKNIYVEVKATNLTGQYHVLLDRCYASISQLPDPNNSTYFNLFVPCDLDQLTTMVENGDSQSARFYFPAFRFVEQQDEKMSTYYLHCITRLCEISTCSTFKQCQPAVPVGNRKRRAADSTTDVQTITSPEIITSANNDGMLNDKELTKRHADTTVGLGVAVGILASACLIGLLVATVFYKRLRN